MASVATELPAKVHMTTTMPHYVGMGTGKTSAQITPRMVDAPSTSAVGPQAAPRPGRNPAESSAGENPQDVYRERGELVPHEAKGVRT